MNSSIPEDIKKFADSAELFEICEKIGQKFSLHIDQIDELDAQVRAVLRGNAQSKNFTSDIMKFLEINRGLAEEITKEVNKDIFESIRVSMRSGDSNSVEDHSQLERAGGFKIVPNYTEKTASVSSLYGKSEVPDSRADMVAHIENPMPTIRKTEPRKSINLLDPSNENPLKEPLVDQLLKNSAAAPEQKVDMRPAAAPQPSQAPQPPKNLPTNDPYREAMN